MKPRKIFLRLLLIVIALSLFTVHAISNAQSNTCQIIAQKALEIVTQMCSALQVGELCKSADTTTVPASSATISKLNDLTSISGQADIGSEKWAVSLARVQIPSNQSVASLGILGDATVTNLIGNDQTFVTAQVTNTNNSAVNIVSSPASPNKVIGTLEPQTTAIANARTQDSMWIRVESENLVGWVKSIDVALDEDISTLVIADFNDFTTIYRAPLQNISLVTNVAQACADTPNGLLVQAETGKVARFLVNGVQLEIMGASYISAPGGTTLTVEVTSGISQVIAQGVAIDLAAGQSTQVTLSNNAPTAAPSAATDAPSGVVKDLVNGAFGGQPYNGAESTIQGFSVTATRAAKIGDLVQVNLRYTGDAAICAPKSSGTPSVALAIDSSANVSSTEFSEIKAALQNSLYRLRAISPALILYGGTSRVINDMGKALTPQVIEGLALSNDDLRPAPELALADALSQFKDADPDSPKVIIIITSNFTPNSLFTKLFADIRQQNIRLIMVKMGAGEVSTTITDAVEFLPSISAAKLGATIDRALSRIAHATAATNVQLTYTVDTDKFEIIPEFLSLSSAEQSNDRLIQWRADSIADSETLDATLVLRAKQAGAAPAGVAQLLYNNCSGQAVTSAGVKTPMITVSEAAPQVADQLILRADTTVNDSIAAYARRGWLLDVPTDELTTIQIDGLDSAPSLLLDGAEPIYSYSADKTYTSVFFIKNDSSRWLTLTSDGAASSGVYTLTVKPGLISEPTQVVTVDGPRITDEQNIATGNLYALDGATVDSVVTLRVALGEKIDPKQPPQVDYKVVSLDGALPSQVVTSIDTNNNELVSVLRLAGSGPYYVYVRYQGSYAITVESDDTVSTPRGALVFGTNRNGQTRSKQAETLSYDLNVADAGLYTMRVSSAVTKIRLNDSALHRVFFSKVLKVNDFQIYSFDLTPGNYSFFIEASGVFEVSATKGETIANLKGSLNLGNTVDEILPGVEDFAIYQLNTGTIKPLETNDLVTLQISASEVASDNVFIESADGLTSELLQFAIDNRNTTNSLLTSVHRLRGVSPYRIRVNGQHQYRLTALRGDLLNADKGRIVVGQSLKDSSRSTEILTYLLTPELGRKLGEGDVFTIDFTGVNFTTKNEDGKVLAVFDVSFELVNGRSEAIPVIDTYTLGGRIRSVFQLQGQGPYNLKMPNVGAYELSVQPGNKIREDKGPMPVDRLQSGITNGPKVLQYTIDEPTDSEVTITVRLPNYSASDLFTTINNATVLTNGDGRKLALSAITYISTFDGLKFVYPLRGEGPFTLTLAINGAYETRYERGDKITFFRGAYLIGDTETARLDATEPKVIAFDSELKRDQLVTVWTYNLPSFVSPSGIYIQPQEYFTVRDRELGFYYKTLYRVPADGKYLVQFYAYNGFNYTFGIRDGNELTLDKGQLFYDFTEKDQLPNEYRYAQYTFDGNPGDEITLKLSRPNGGTAFEAKNILILDKEGRQVEPIDQLLLKTVSPSNLTQTYLLTGSAPYTLVLQPPRFNDTSTDYPHSPYQIDLRKQDTLNVHKGLMPLDQLVSDGVPNDDGYRHVFYTVDRPEGSSVTFKLGTPSQREAARLQEIVLLDANGNEVSEDLVNFTTSDRSYYYSYKLVGPGPYNLRLSIANAYALLTTEGNTLDRTGGTLTAGTTTEGKLEAPAIVASYLIPEAEGAKLNIQLEIQGRRSDIGVLVDANDQPIPADAVLAGQKSIYVYQLIGQSPYKFRFLTGTAQYKISDFIVEEGEDGIPKDLLTFNGGTLTVNPATFDDPQARPVENTGRVTDVQRFVYGLIDQPEGATITMDLELRGARSTPDPLMLDADNNAIEPNVTLANGSRLFAVYKLTGKSPYRLAFGTASDYRVLLTEGDTLRQTQANIPTGLQDKPLEFEINEPARIAVHPLDVGAGQLITVQVQTQARNGVDVKLIDGAGSEIASEISDFQNGNNIRVYILSGVGPYQVSFPSSGRYTASVQAGNLLRVDGGVIPFNEEHEGELDEPGRVLTYVIDGKRDQLVTIQLEADNREATIEFRDANGKLWPALFEFTRQNVRYIVHQLSGPPPYNFTFGSRRYTVTVASGNALQADLGIIPFDQSITNTLVAPAVTAIYGVEGQPGEQVSFLLQDARRAAEGTAYDSENNPLVRNTFVSRNNQGISVYTLSGKAPYRFEFFSSGPYTIRAQRGNALRADLGVIPYDVRLGTTLPFPADTAVYLIDAQEGETVLVELQVSGRPSAFKVLNGLGVELDADAKLDKNNFRYRQITLRGVAPYTLEFPATTAFNVTVYRGDRLHQQLGAIRFGNEMRGQIGEPAEVAVYTIDALTGQTISLQLQDAGRPLDSQLTDASGTILEPTGKSVANNSTYTVYTLTGTGPYKLTFIPQGQYVLKLFEGSVFTVDFGPVTFGETVRNQLRLPNVEAVYQLVTLPDQVVSVRLRSTKRGEFIPVKLIDQEGNEIAPQTSVFEGDSIAVYVFVLKGPAPYELSFQTTSAYELTSLRGDASQTRFVIFPTPTPTAVPR